MLPEISEFSYGFALTNELVGWTELSAAPVFPSLIEEGKSGGGYDVKLDWPAVPLYLQFKRSERMERRSAKEFQSVTNSNGALDIPFYRFRITEAPTSDQHELLLALDSPESMVFYVAPRFHRLHEINDAWQASAVASRSIFVAPAEIGPLDDQRHSVAFDGSRAWLCSDPREIKGLGSRDVLNKLKGALQSEARPLRSLLPKVVDDLRSAERRGNDRIVAKRREADLREAERRREARAKAVRGVLSSDEASPYSGSIAQGQDGTPAPRAAYEQSRPVVERPEQAPPETRRPKIIQPEFGPLREASDLAARVFDAQLIIVQPMTE